MPFEKFDKRLQEAANQHQPTFETNAWEKMRQLLDEQLPQKKKRKRRIFLFLLFLGLMTAGGTLFFFTPRSGKRVAALQQNKLPPFLEHASSAKAATGKKSDNPKQNNTLETKADHVVVDMLSHSTKTQSLNVAASSPVRNHENSLSRMEKNILMTQKRRHTKTNLIPVASRSLTMNSIHEILAENNVTSKAMNWLPAIGNTDQQHPLDSLLSKGVTTDKKFDAFHFSDVALKSKQTESAKHQYRWALTFSTGPDVSEATANGPGKITLTLGAGLRYAISKRLALRTGFYTAKKIYSASGSSYHPPAGYWTYYYDLKKVDANCTVYEIPLTLSYNFAQANQHSWFAAAGLSSYLMKRETYDYTYKDYAGQLQYKSWSVENKNKHYFSVLDLSAGYQYSISQKVSVMAEPYLRVPLTGIGFGKIKLNSAGVLFTISISAFGQ